METMNASKTLVGLVDPQVSVVRAMSEALTARGFQVVGLTSSTVATKLLADGRCDVVVLREELDALSGSQLCALLRDQLGDGRPGFVRLFREMPSDPGSAGTEYDAWTSLPLDVEQLVAAIASAASARPNAAQVAAPPPPPPTPPRARRPTTPMSRERIPLVPMGAKLPVPAMQTMKPLPPELR